MTSPTRRSTLQGLAASAAALAFPAAVFAAQRASLKDPLRVAADDAMFDSGLAGVLQRAFGQDTGVAVKLVRGPATALLEALERGEHDAAMTNAPKVEIELEKQGLVHDRHMLGRGEVVIVGPLALSKPLGAPRDAALALSRLAQAQVPFLSRGDGSGTHLAEIDLWSAAKVQPAKPWYATAAAGKPLLAQAVEQQACAVVERGAWLARRAGKGFGILVEGDPRMQLEMHVMRTFRAERQHPAGKLFVAWVTGPKGRRLVAAHRGYRSASA